MTETQRTDDADDFELLNLVPKFMVLIGLGFGNQIYMFREGASVTQEQWDNGHVMYVPYARRRDRLAVHPSMEALLIEHLQSKNPRVPAGKQVSIVSEHGGEVIPEGSPLTLEQIISGELGDKYTGFSRIRELEEGVLNGTLKTSGA